METYSGVNMHTEFPKCARVTSFERAAISSRSGSAAGDRRAANPSTDGSAYIALRTSDSVYDEGS